MALLQNKSGNSDQYLTTDFHFPRSTKALIVFTRNPELGKCKTRLAQTVGDQSALDIYKYLLEHTAQTTTAVKAERFVFYSESIIENDIWHPSYFSKRLQEGQDLGERMANAFKELIGLGYSKVLIVGSDLLDLTSTIIEQAFDALDTHEAVFGPAKDGGYYLLGLQQFIPQLFKNKTWSTDTVLESSLKDLKEKSVFLLKELNDIDTFEDLKPYKELQHLYRL